MQVRTAVALSILLCGIALVGSRLVEPAEASSSPVRTGYVRPEWKLGMPATSGNLTVFPVISTAWSPASDFITLDEGLKSGKVVITELGSGGPGGRAQDGAQVNSLSLTNRTGRTLILLAGEMLIGGKQDRIVDEDQLVPPGERPVALGVFCVEHGRWHGASTSFGQNQPAQRSQAPGAQNFLGGSSGRGAGGQQIATPAIREKAEAAKSQTEVWSKVADTNHSLNTTSGTGALTRAYDDRTLAIKSRAYESRIINRIQGNNVVGVVVAVNGQLVAADIFANPFLFQRYWPKLLKSYVLEALSAGAAPRGEIDRLAAEAFLYRAEGNASSERQKSVYRLTEHKSGGNASFELDSLTGPEPVLVHFNRIASR